MVNQQEFIDKCAAELGGSYLAILEAQHLWCYFKDCSDYTSDNDKRKARDRFFIQLRQSLDRMAIWRQIRS